MNRAIFIINVSAWFDVRRKLKLNKNTIILSMDCVKSIDNTKTFVIFILLLLVKNVYIRFLSKIKVDNFENSWIDSLLDEQKHSHFTIIRILIKFIHVLM